MAGFYVAQALKENGGKLKNREFNEIEANKEFFKQAEQWQQKDKN